MSKKRNHDRDGRKRHCGTAGTHITWDGTQRNRGRQLHPHQWPSRSQAGTAMLTRRRRL